MTNQTPTPAEPICILLVDDDPDSRIVARDVIGATSLCAIVREARDGLEALEYLARCGPGGASPRPDLVCMDVEMPRLGGLETLQRMKSDPRWREIPVVMLTSVDDEAARRQILTLGACAHIVKPAEPTEFLLTVMKNVRAWAPVGELPAEASAGEADRETQP